MDGLESSLHLLAAQNRSGVAFLGAYGVTWLVCALLWSRAREERAALVTLFQGVVALPAALLISALIGGMRDRPVSGLVTQLSVLVASSQLLALPLLVVLFTRRKYTAIPVLFALGGALHFLPYAWLYRTPVYLAMSVVIALGVALVCLRDRRDPLELSRLGAARICAVMSTLLLVSAGLVLL